MGSSIASLTKQDCCPSRSQLQFKIDQLAMYAPMLMIQITLFSILATKHVNAVQSPCSNLMQLIIVPNIDLKLPFQLRHNPVDR